MHIPRFSMSSHQFHSLRAALPWLLLVTGMFFLNFTARLLFAPLLPAMQEDMGLTHAQAGRLLLSFSVGYGVMLFFAGQVYSRLPHRKVVSYSVLFMGACMVLVGLAPTKTIMYVAIVLFGMMGGLYLPSGLATLTSLIAPKHYGRTMAIHELAPNFSFILTPLIAEALLYLTNWRMTLVIFGGSMMAIAIVFRKIARGGDSPGDPPRLDKARQLVVSPAFWALLGLFIVAIGTSMGPYAMLPLYLLHAHDYTRSEANHLLTISRLSGPIVALMAGWAIDRMGAKQTMVVYLIFAAVTTAALGYTEGNWLVAAVVAQPICSIIFFPAAFAYLSRMFTNADRDLAITCIIPSAIVIGNGVIPQVLGILGDHHAFHVGFYGIGVLSLCSLILVRMLDDVPKVPEVHG